LQPHLSKYWKIPPDGDAAFVAAMEDVLAVYQLPHDPRFPVVCMDESNKQLVGEVRAPIATAPGHGRILDHEYVRHGIATLFVEVEPLAGRRHVEVTERRTRQDWARFIKTMLVERYPQAIKVRLVMDNLNTHDLASLYETFPPAEARRLAERIEIHYTPKHGSWLNIAEIELSALNGQCLRRRIPSATEMRRHIAAWQPDRNTRGAPVNWRFTTEDARIKLTRLYPKL
jgi:DDE superfamily endonuclease